jgi:hypothetical protein
MLGVIQRRTITRIFTQITSYRFPGEVNDGQAVDLPSPNLRGDLKKLRDRVPLMWSGWFSVEKF